MVVELFLEMISPFLTNESLRKFSDNRQGHLQALNLTKKSTAQLKRDLFNIVTNTVSALNYLEETFHLFLQTNLLTSERVLQQIKENERLRNRSDLQN
jgi:hypothetical protein